AGGLRAGSRRAWSRTPPDGAGCRASHGGSARRPRRAREASSKRPSEAGASRAARDGTRRDAHDGVVLEVMPRLVVARDHADEVVLEGELRDVVEGHGLAVVAEVHVEPHLRRDLVVVLLVLDAGDVREDLREAASFHADT